MLKAEQYKWAKIAVVVLVVLLLIWFFWPSKKLTKVPIPKLPETVELSVAYVINPRFNGLSRKELDTLLKKTSDSVKKHFGLNVSFKTPVQLSIEQFFNYLPDSVKQSRASAIVDPVAISAEDTYNLKAGIFNTLKDYGYNTQQIIEFAKPYLIRPLASQDLEGLSSALTDTLLTRLKYWYELKADDGQAVLNGKPYNEWVWWDSIGYGNMPYDVVITNQLVASAELYDMDVHSSIRGGITGGTTSFSGDSTYYTYTFITVYHLLNDYELLQTLRNDTTYTEDEITTFAATLLTHELGHLLLHLGHPFGQTACVMSPAPLLKYREWHDGLNPDACKINSNPDMTPGRIKFNFRPGPF